MIKVVPKIMTLLEIFADGKEYSFASITERTHLTRSNVSHLLQALCDNEILIKSSYGKYRRGRRLTNLCVGCDPWQRLMSIAERCAENSVGLLNELVVIGLRDHDRRLTIVKRRPEKNLQVNHESGTRYRADWYSTANGRILLAYAPEEIVEQTIRRYGPPEKQVWREASTLPKLKHQLALIRRQGFTMMNVDEEIRAIGVPVRDASGSYLLSVATAFPVFCHKDDDQKILEQLCFLAGTFEQELSIGGIRIADLNQK